MSRLANRFRHLAPGVLLLIAAFAPLGAHAQLRGLGGSGTGVGGIGALGSGSAASPGISSAPLGSVGNVGSDLRPPLGPTSSIPQSPIDPNAVTNSVTNTLNGDVTAPLANTAGRARTALGDTVGRIGENTGIARVATPAQGRSRVPPVGEQRFVSDEVLVGLPSNLTPQALDALARRYGLTRLESQHIGLTGTTFHRWRISDRRSVADVVRELEADRWRPRGAAQLSFRPPAECGRRRCTAGAVTLQYSAAKLRARHRRISSPPAGRSWSPSSMAASMRLIPSSPGGVVESVDATRGGRRRRCARRSTQLRWRAPSWRMRG